MSKILRQIITTSAAPKPQGPYSQAVQVDKLVYLSGVVGMDPKTNQLVKGTIKDEVRQALTNISAILQASGSGLEKLVKTTILLNDIGDFSDVNEVYKEFFSGNYPARSTYQVGKLPLGAKVEIEAIGLCGEIETKTVQK